jgi:hypothetical protein
MMLSRDPNGHHPPQAGQQPHGSRPYPLVGTAAPLRSFPELRILHLPATRSRSPRATAAPCSEISPAAIRSRTASASCSTAPGTRRRASLQAERAVADGDRTLTLGCKCTRDSRQRVAYEPVPNLTTFRKISSVVSSDSKRIVRQSPGRKAVRLGRCLI